MTSRTSPLRCRYCGELCDLSELCVYGDIALCDGCADRDASDLLIELVRLRETVEWYGVRSHYDPRHTSSGVWCLPSEMDQDAGKRARAALGIER